MFAAALADPSNTYEIRKALRAHTYPPDFKQLVQELFYVLQPWQHVAALTTAAQTDAF